MKKTVLSFLVITLCATLAVIVACGGGGEDVVNGRTPWAGTVMINSTGPDIVYGISVDSGGNLYVTGHTEGNLHGHTNLGLHDVFVSKYDSGGVRQWTEMMNTTASDRSQSVTVDTGGNVYVAGYTFGNLHGHTNIGGGDGFVAMYNSGGVRQWTAMMNTTATDSAYGVSVGSGGNVYVTGVTYGNLHGHTNIGGGDGFVAMYNSGGIHQWTEMINTTANDSPIGVSVDSGGNVYVAGGAYGDLHGHKILGLTDVFVSKYDSGGVRQWTAMMNTTAIDTACGVSGDSEGNVYVAGWTYGDLPGHTNIGGGDGFVAMYNSGGVQQWTEMMNTTAFDSAYGVTVDSRGNVYVAGATEGNLHGHTTLGGPRDAFVSMYDSGGVRQWTAMMNTTSSDTALGVSVDSEGNVYVAGHTDGNLHGHTNLGRDGFIVKFDTAGTLQ